jgi:hypothetical protein
MIHSAPASRNPPIVELLSTDDRARVLLDVVARLLESTLPAQRATYSTLIVPIMPADLWPGTPQ